MLRNCLPRALIAAAVLVAAGAAQATLVSFKYIDASNVAVASGSFTYADGTTGILGYGALSAFNVTIGWHGWLLLHAGSRLVWRLRQLPSDPAFQRIDFQRSEVPAPVALALVGVALFGVSAARRRRPATK